MRYGRVPVLCRVMSVPRHLLVRGGERRVVVSTIDIVDRGVIGGGGGKVTRE